MNHNRALTFLLLALTFALSSSAQTQSNKNTKLNSNKKWNNLMHLIEQEIVTINNVKKKSSSLKYRLLELQSEKLKLWKQKENDKFMRMSLKGKKISRSNAFRKTLQLYNQTRKQGVSIIKKHPRSPYKAAIYYTLALNSRDYSYDQREFKYLKSALHFAPKKSEIHYLARTSLAEYYYNKKKYSKAVAIYSSVTKNLDDEWHTKNLYNYGWCLLKTHHFERAITTLEKAYELSALEHYIDFRTQIMDGLVNFYVLGKQINRGKKFILSKVDDKFKALFKYTQKVSRKGFKAQALELIRLTEKYIDKEHGDTQLADLRIFQYDFHKQFNEKQEMYNIALDISKIKLSLQQKEDITFKITEEVGTQQLILKNEYNKEDGIYTKKRLTIIIDYFKLLSIFDKKNTAKYLFYSAETLYTVAEFKKALTYYREAIEKQAIMKSDISINEKAIDSLFSCIALGELSKKDKNNELEYAYLKHITLWPKKQKSFLIYPKLFALYLFSNRFKMSQETIDLFIKNFPKNVKDQQKLFIQQIDYFIKNEKISLISQKVNLMYQGYLSFKFEETKRTEKILADILFRKYQNLSENGEKEKALAGYKNIFYKEQYPKSVRADAAFNMGIIYIDLYNSSSGVKWFKKSFPLFTKVEKVKRRNFLEKVSLRSSLLQDFLNAANIQKIVLQLFCFEDKKKNLASFNKAIIYDLANDYITKAMHTYDAYKKCTSQKTNFIDEYIFTHLYQMGHEAMFSRFTAGSSIKHRFSSKLGYYFETLYWKYQGENKRKEILYSDKLRNLKCPNCELFFKAKRELKLLNKSIERNLNGFVEIGKKKGQNQKFNQERFNIKLSKKLASIKSVLNQGDKLLALAHPQISIITYDKLTNYIIKFAALVNQIQAPIKNKEFEKQFRSQMMILSKQIRDQKDRYINNANTFIEKNQILTLKQTQTHMGFDILQLGETRAPAGKMLSTLDLDLKK